MQFEPKLQAATLIRRYKRFLADATLPCGEKITLHCPNTGAMTGCAEPGSTLWFSTSNNPKRKYSRTWELTQTPANEWICVNTHNANALVEQALRNQPPQEFRGYTEIKREVKYGEKSRIDLLLQGKNKADYYLEIKSVTLHAGAGQGYFPDTRSERATRQLEELTQLCRPVDATASADVCSHFHSVASDPKMQVTDNKAQKKAAVIYAVLHEKIKQVKAAKHIDPAYNAALEKAKEAGLIVLEAHFQMSPTGITFTHWRT